MLRWISREYKMSTADLARMFQRDQGTIHTMAARRLYLHGERREDQEKLLFPIWRA
jgi:hypothetical protein